MTQRKIEPLYTEFLKLDDGLRAEIDSVLYEICLVADCPVNAMTLHVQIQQHGLVPPDVFAEWSIHDKAAWVCLNSDSAWTQSGPGDPHGRRRLTLSALSEMGGKSMGWCSHLLELKKSIEKCRHMQLRHAWGSTQDINPMVAYGKQHWGKKNRGWRRV